jgi:hypothetical protein
MLIDATKQKGNEAQPTGGRDGGGGGKGGEGERGERGDAFRALLLQKMQVMDIQWSKRRRMKRWRWTRRRRDGSKKQEGSKGHPVLQLQTVIK